MYADMMEVQMDFTEKTIDTKEIYKGRIIHVKEDVVTLPNGKIEGRELVLHNGGVGVIAIDADLNVLMVKQYRKPFEAILLEIPAGKLELGEDIKSAAIRELREETGFLAKKTDFLCESYPSPGYLTEKIHLYIARDLEFVGQELDPGEFIEVYKIPIDKLVDMVIKNEIKDAKTQIAILMADKIIQKENDKNE